MVRSDVRLLIRPNLQVFSERRPREAPVTGVHGGFASADDAGRRGVM